MLATCGEKATARRFHLVRRSPTPMCRRAQLTSPRKSTRPRDDGGLEDGHRNEAAAADASRLTTSAYTRTFLHCLALPNAIATAHHQSTRGESGGGVAQRVRGAGFTISAVEHLGESEGFYRSVGPLAEESPSATFSKKKAVNDCARKSKLSQAGVHECKLLTAILPAKHCSGCGLIETRPTDSCHLECDGVHGC